MLFRDVDRNVNRSRGVWRRLDNDFGVSVDDDCSECVPELNVVRARQRGTRQREAEQTTAEDMHERAAGGWTRGGIDAGDAWLRELREQWRCEQKTEDE